MESNGSSSRRLLRKNEWEDMEVGLLDLEYVKQRLALRRRSFTGTPQMEPKYQMDLLPMMMYLFLQFLRFP